MASDLALRPIRHADADLLWAWRSDSDTARASRRRELRRQEYLDEYVLHPKNHRRTFVAELDGVAVGMGTLEDAGFTTEVSITVAPEHRGKGLAVRLIQALVDKADRRYPIVAVIRAENARSLKAFARAGFAPTPEQFVRYEWQVDR